jgi:mitogen-activated protein kinase kinase kinase
MVNSRPSSQGNGAIPRLSVSTAPSPSPSQSQSQAGPSSQIGSIGRRPLGARKRGVAAGLYVANPDNSDDDGSPVQGQSNSPIRTQSSPTATGTGRTSYEGEYRGLPTIPHQATPPLPPPQPDRHNQSHTARRAFTTPPEAPQVPQRPHDTRHSSLSAQGQGQGQSNVPPPSPSRLSRHALPSPPTQSSPPTQESRRLPQPQPQPQPNPNIRMSSPEEGISPVVEGGSGFRARTGSFNTSAKRLLQVTTDNEQFTLVDITGMNTAEAIRDRIFSKVRYTLGLVGSGTDE